MIFQKTNIAHIETVPFDSVEEAWFWFMETQEAMNDGAKFTAGMSLRPRPCEPIDIMKAVDNLYRNRRLVRDHLLVLRHYGRRRMAPDPRRAKESRAFTLWEEAMMRLESILENKGIIRRNDHFWPENDISADIMEGAYTK